MYKTNRGHSTQSNIEYPKLRCSIDTGNIVLFTTKDKGTVIEPGWSPFSKGYYSNHWCSRLFEDLSPQETITLQNKQ